MVPVKVFIHGKLHRELDADLVRSWFFNGKWEHAFYIGEQMVACYIGPVLNFMVPEGKELEQIRGNPWPQLKRQP